MKGCYGMDETNIIGLLDEEFKNLMAKLSKIDITDDEKNKLVGRLETISKIRNERYKTDFEKIDTEEKREEEFRKNQQKIKDDKRDFWTKIGLTVFEVGLPIIVYSVWAYLGFKFEENGTIRSQISKNINNRMKATK